MKTFEVTLPKKNKKQSQAALHMEVNDLVPIY